MLLAGRTAFFAMVAFLSGLCLAEEFVLPKVDLPAGGVYPRVACSPEELARVREAYRGQGPEHDIVAGIVKRADHIIAEPLIFPPRGGQHNQWYQCDKCEIALKTIDDTHHQCPLCKKMYSGEPYDDVVFARKHLANLSRMTTAAWAYAVTGDRRYAEYTARVLLGYADRYLAYPYHANTKWNVIWLMAAGGHLFEQTLSEASSMVVSIAPSYDLIHDSGVLTEEDHATIREKLLLPMLRNIDKNKLEKGNWQSWHNAALFLGGAMLDDVSWMRKAVLEPEYGFLCQMRTCVSAEGMWYENSWGYHVYALQALTALAEGARRMGIDLWGHPSLRKMFTLPIHYTMADGSLPRFGDDVRSSAWSCPQIMEAAYAAYKDPDLLTVLPARPIRETVFYGRDPSRQGKPPILKSEVFQDAGHAILRTKGAAGLTAAMTFGPYGGFHGHYDKLSFVFFGFKKELAVDPGRARSQAYRLPIHKKWYKTTIAHNAVLVDGKCQNAATGKLEFFAERDKYAVVAASCDDAYPGVACKRLLFLSTTYLLVVDTLSARSARRFDWVYHNRGTAVQCDAAGQAADLRRIGAGGEYIQHAREGKTDQACRICFAGDSVDTHLTILGKPNTRVAIGDGPGESVTDRVPLAILSREGRSARFVVAIEPVAKGTVPTVRDISCEEQGGTLMVTITSNDKADRISITPNNTFLQRGVQP